MIDALLTDQRQPVLQLDPAQRAEQTEQQDVLESKEAVGNDPIPDGKPIPKHRPWIKIQEDVPSNGLGLGLWPLGTHGRLCQGQQELVFGAIQGRAEQNSKGK